MVSERMLGIVGGRVECAAGWGCYAVKYVYTGGVVGKLYMAKVDIYHCTPHVPYTSTPRAYPDPPDTTPRHTSGTSPSPPHQHILT